MKTYQSYQAEAKQAEAKLKVAENQRLKIEQAVPKEKLDKSKKVKLIGKEVQKVIIYFLFFFNCILETLLVITNYLYFRERINTSMPN